MSSRPGARLAGRPLHFVFLLDGSGSMADDGKVDALNRAVREALPSLRDLAEHTPFVDLLVRAVVFADGARWHIGTPTPVAEVSWPPVVAGGYTDLGAGLALVSQVLQVPPMDERALAPVLVLVSDGRPTDDFQAGMDLLLTEPWGRRAVRLAIAIGSDAALDVLQQFIADPEIQPFSAHDPEQLAYLVRFSSLAASRLVSRVADGGQHRVMPQPQPPPAADAGLMVW